MSSLLTQGDTPATVEAPRTRDLGDPGFWRALAPGLRVEDVRSVQALEAITPSAADMAAIRALVVEEGYFQASGIAWPMDIALMADTVRMLDRAGLPAVFAFLYDEFWIPFYRLQPIYAGLLGDYMMLPDFWVWNVDPARGDAGWRPHRDKGHAALFPDGTPKSITTWMPLSRATPLNGCMYIVPATQDPTYNTPEDKEWRFEYAGIRALPAEAGDVFMWNQAVLHWGSRTSPRGGASRVSMAFEFQRADVAPFNQPLMKPLEFHSFAARLRLIAKQILQYRHMYKVDPAIERVARAVLAAPG
ncbi:MAG: phytanoyl-CoA dioxygenase family protein [Acetobacteraceae bacterium]|nr:phytanoyl-CoA dioxygenase family protein [Acetobacteraceae bacterium]